MGSVELEVYSTTRASAAARTWLAAVLLFVLACLCAALLSRARADSGLSDRVFPLGWKASFRPPEGFSQVEPPQGRPGLTFVFERSGTGDGLVEITVRRLERPNPSVEEIVGRIMQPHLQLLQALFSTPPTRLAAPLGSLEGVEVRHPGIPMIVRTAETPLGDAFAVSLRTRGAPIDDRLYRIFEAVCRSFAVADM